MTSTRSTRLRQCQIGTDEAWPAAAACSQHSTLARGELPRTSTNLFSTFSPLCANIWLASFNSNEMKAVLIERERAKHERECNRTRPSERVRGDRQPARLVGPVCTHSSPPPPPSPSSTCFIVSHIYVRFQAGCWPQASGTATTHTSCVFHPSSRL